MTNMAPVAIKNCNAIGSSSINGRRKNAQKTVALLTITGVETLDATFCPLM